MAARKPIVIGSSGLPQQLQAADTLAGASSVSRGLVGVLNIPSGVILAGVAGTDNVIDWLVTAIKASDGTSMTPQGGKLRTPAATLFTASADIYVAVVLLGNATGADVSGVSLTLAGLVIPGPSIIPAGNTLLLTKDGWVARNATGGAL